MCDRELEPYTEVLNWCSVLKLFFAFFHPRSQQTMSTFGNSVWCQILPFLRASVAWTEPRSGKGSRPRLVLTSIALLCSVYGHSASIHLQNLRLVPSPVPDIRGSQNLKSRSCDLGHAPVWPIFIFGLVSCKVNQRAKFEVCIFSRSRDISGSQNLKSRLCDLCHSHFWPIFHFLL